MNSMKANIGNFKPNTFGSNQINWKELREQGAIPFRFYMLIKNVKEVDTKAGEKATIIEGDCELDTTGLSEDRIAELERISGVNRDKPTPSSFYPVGSMHLNQMKEKYGEKWYDLEEFQLCHIAYNGKLDNPKKQGQKFHQIFITLVPDAEQEEAE